MYNISDVQICNLALVSIKAEEIERLDEKTPSGEACKLFYPQTVSMVLSGNRWNFAREEVDLALLSDITDPDWKYVYNYPVNCLQSLYLDYDINYEAPPKYDIRYFSEKDIKGICTNRVNARLVFTANITNTVLFPPLFVEAVRWQLASALLKPLNATVSDAKYFETKFNQAILEATTQNAIATQKKQVPGNYLMKVRLGGMKLNNRDYS